ncbi:MAG: Periplasmic protein involved in polysaccharide export [Acidobacteria bacterium]|nr:Periplasmic protein involved in polysaccharide export [Acidobacteriota bacterium]
MWNMPKSQLRTDPKSTIGFRHGLLTHARWFGLLPCVLLMWQPAGAQTSAEKTQATGATTAAVVTPKQPVTQLKTPFSNAATDEHYKIGPGDVLDIRILNRPNLSRDAVRVEGNGTIRMPLIDTPIMAGCLSESELAKEISNRYLKFYRNPQVDVFIKEFKGSQVAIIGFVGEQGRFQLQRRIRLLDLLTYAKGPATNAGQTINVVHSPTAHQCDEGDQVNESLATGFASYRLRDTMLGAEAANPYLENGDIVTLPEADQIYVVGNVKVPRAIPLKEPITLSQAIAMAGGLGMDSKKEKIRVVRQQPGSNTKKEIYADLSAIEKKKAEDISLMPNDIVDVPTSGAKSLIRSLMGTIAPSVGQLPVRVIP